MVHKRNPQKYQEKTTKFLVRKKCKKIVLDSAFFDREKCELINTLTEEEVVARLKKEGIIINQRDKPSKT